MLHGGVYLPEQRRAVHRAHFAARWYDRDSIRRNENSVL